MSSAVYFIHADFTAEGAEERRGGEEEEGKKEEESFWCVSAPTCAVAQGRENRPMANVKNLRLVLARQPEVDLPPGIELRHYVGAADIEAWLDLRGRAFAREKLGVGQWDAGDFEREFLSKPWWSPERMWLAQSTQTDGLSQVVGTVTWADRGVTPEAKAAVHWLAVLPGYRRRGIGRLLLETLHWACWDAGHREIYLETHVAWAGAARLYTSLGYRPV